jgi:hypothetical protein
MKRPVVDRCHVGANKCEIDCPKGHGRSSSHPYSVANWVSLKNSFAASSHSRKVSRLGTMSPMLPAIF